MAFIDHVLPAPVGGGFAMDDYWVWCGSAIHGDDGQYHLFAARWPQDLPFFDGYKVHSEVVRVVSPTPEGPYEFAEVVLKNASENEIEARVALNVPTMMDAPYEQSVKLPPKQSSNNPPSKSSPQTEKQ